VTTLRYPNPFLPGVLAGLLFIFGPVFQAEGNSASQITLSDGSVIQGKIVGFTNGTYQIQTQSLGTMQIPESQVRTIRRPSASTDTAPPSPRSGEGMGAANAQPQAQQIQQQMMNDPQTMQMILQLQNDPAIQKILSDPELMNAIQQGDVNRVAQDPSFQALMKNKTVGDIIEKSTK